MVLAYGFPNDPPVLNGGAGFVIPLRQQILSCLQESEPGTAAEHTPTVKTRWAKPRTTPSGPMGPAEAEMEEHPRFVAGPRQAHNYYAPQASRATSNWELLAVHLGMDSGATAYAP